MTTASVFISHSVKDAEKAPPPDAGEDQRARWRRLCVARKLRDAIKLALEDLGAEPWLDQRDIEPGMLWRDAIHHGLLRCHGAVLLLTPESLQSRWVLKEATVLTWIQALGFPIVIVPVLMGVRLSDLEEHGFGPLSLEAIQSEAVGIDLLDGSDDWIDDTARLVASRFNRVVTSLGDTGLDIWARKVTSCWRGIELPDLRRMMAALGMADRDVSDARLEEVLGNPGQGVARELLLNEWRTTLRALEQLAGFDIDWRRMRQHVQPLWVPAAAAKILPLIAAKPPGQRTILVAGTEPATGRDVVIRAYCGQLSSNRLVAPDDAGDDPEVVIGHLEQEIIERGATESGDVTVGRPFFVVVGYGAATPEIVDRLRTRFGEVTYVVMAGRGRDALLQLNPQPYVLRPDLGAECEREAKIFAKNLIELDA